MGSEGVKTYGSALAELDNYLGQLRKTAAETSEDATSHPIQSEDDQLGAAAEGARSAENEADITSDVGPQNINDAAPATDEEPKPVALTDAATTGKDPSNETAGVKMNKEDPGTTHPAKAGTEKGAEYLTRVKQACVQYGAEKVATELGNSIMADIATLGDRIKAASPQDIENAANAGARAADNEIEKIAEAQLPGLVDFVTKQAEADALNLAQFYDSFIKAAEGEEEPEEAVSGEEDAEAGDAGEEGALPAEDLAQLASVAAPEEAAALGAEAPVEGMGMEGAMPAEPGEEEVVEALSEALADAGVTPEELSAAVAAQGAATDIPLEQKMAAVKTANLATAEVNRYRNLKAIGRVGREKRANIQLTWSIRQMIKDVMGK